MKLVDRMVAALTPPNGKVTPERSEFLDRLVNRQDAREHLRGRGPYQRFRVRHDLDDLIRSARRRANRRRKRVERRLRARGRVA